MVPLFNVFTIVRRCHRAEIFVRRFENSEDFDLRLAWAIELARAYSLKWAWIEANSHRAWRAVEGEIAMGEYHPE